MDPKSHFCAICKEIPPKYKCSSCEAPYCSVVCWKKHKESGENHCEVPEKAGNHNIPTEKSTILFPTEDTVPENKLEMLRSCDELKNLLRNPHLRRLLQEVDGATNAEKAMRAAMQEPLFTEFADEVLKVVEPPDQRDDT